MSDVSAIWKLYWFGCCTLKQCLHLTGFMSQWLEDVEITSAYIPCAHSGTSTQSFAPFTRLLHSLKLCASHLHSRSHRSLELCTSYSLQHSRFALACSAEQRSTIIIIKKKKNCPRWESNLHTESSPDLQSNALATQPSRKLCKLIAPPPFFF